MLTIYISSQGLKSRIHPQLGTRLSNGFPQRRRDSRAGEENGLWWSNHEKPADKQNRGFCQPFQVCH